MKISADEAGFVGMAQANKAEEEARELYGCSTWAKATLYEIPPEKLIENWEGSHISSILKTGDMEEYKIDSFEGYISQDEPKCISENGHHWAATYEREGGIKENPGVWGHGAGVILHDHCTRCNVIRKKDTWGTNPFDGTHGHEMITYGEAENA